MDLNTCFQIVRRDSLSGPCEDDCEVSAPFIDLLPEESEEEEPSPLDFGGARRYGYPGKNWTDLF